MEVKIKNNGEMLDATIEMVNGESRINTDEKGAALLRETEKRGFVKIRSYEYK